MRDECGVRFDPSDPRHYPSIECWLQARTDEAIANEARAIAEAQAQSDRKVIAGGTLCFTLAALYATTLGPVGWLAAGVFVTLGTLGACGVIPIRPDRRWLQQQMDELRWDSDPIALDLDAIESAWKLGEIFAKENFSKVRVAEFPVKPDDLFAVHNGSRDDVEAILAHARPV